MSLVNPLFYPSGYRFSQPVWGQESLLGQVLIKHSVYEIFIPKKSIFIDRPIEISVKNWMTFLNQQDVVINQRSLLWVVTVRFNDCAGMGKGNDG